MLELTQIEFESLMSQIAISKKGRGGRRKLPMAFTEHGALMAATVLNSPQAVNVSLYVVRAFVQMREFLLSHQDLAAKLATLERRVEELAFEHSTQTRSTRIQLQQAFEAIRELMALPPEPNRRPIGFVTPEEKPSGKAAVRRRYSKPG